MIYNDLALFTAVARHLSFSDAADQIGIPLSRVSRRIAELESHLGVRLLERTTRRVRLTEEGRRLLDRCQEPIEALQDLAGFADDTGHRTIRITAPPLAVRTTIGPRLLDFAECRPEIRIDLTTTNVMLDFFRDNIDLAFRLGPLSDSRLIARRLWAVPYCFCAGERFIDRYAPHGPVSREQLQSLPAIVSRQPWILQHGEPLRPDVVLHELDDLDLVAEATRRNLGVAMLPRDMVNGDLRPLAIVDAEPMPREMFAVYPSRRLLPARVRDLIDFMSGLGP